MMFLKKTKIQRLIEKNKRKLSKPEKTKKTKMINNKAKLRKIFNEYIRVRDSIKTTGSPFYCRCCTCNSVVPNDGQKLDAGHYILSRHNTVTFDEINLHGQCRKCNSFQGGSLDEYSMFIIKAYGMKKFEWLLNQKHVQKKFTAVELIGLQMKYSEKLDELIKDFPDYKRKSTKVNNQKKAN